MGSKHVDGAPAWTPTIHALLRHLEDAGYQAAPRVVCDGPGGTATLSVADGPVAYPHPWSDEGIWQVGKLLRDLHAATATFRPPPGALWPDWWMHHDGSGSVIGHCDAGPWYTIALDGLPVAFIGWEVAGPVDPLDEVAIAGWWHAYLRDDDIAARYGLPDAVVRARQLRQFLEGYRLAAAERAGIVDRMIELAIRDCAAEATYSGVTPDSVDPAPLWAIAWRARSAAWMIRHQALLERVIH